MCIHSLGLFGENTHILNSRRWVTCIYRGCTKCKANQEHVSEDASEDAPEEKDRKRVMKLRPERYKLELIVPFSAVKTMMILT